ncbi:hypothetical protein OG455_22460 [Kitasatospora sp. NBC_01287]|uniref:hypothetical protein n=1 Tax=Kitasatospora sp. NBC_01287 TaxID=2903573 RepID=UPI00225291CE|nr:hypothetical protein [Kitasatospora sp. NBC_01287]MCX4748243.1 hypothetical protein [Kitasatospora sp. NBC_01287]
MKQLVRRIGQTIALTLPVILVTTGTLAVTRVAWAPPVNDSQQVVAAASGSGGGIGRTATTADVTGTTAHPGLSPQDALRTDLMSELRSRGAAAALDLLERSMTEEPNLTPYCTTLAKELGQATLKLYQGDVQRARSVARPVCDGSFAAGIAG